jgi:hypothetical protein
VKLDVKNKNPYKIRVNYLMVENKGKVRYTLEVLQTLIK